MILTAYVPSALPQASLIEKTPPAAAIAGKKETVFKFYGPMPTGVAVSHSGRVFVCFPRWGDDVKSTVTEIKNGRLISFPPEMNGRAGPANGASGLVSVQSVVVDAADRLWCLDTGSVEMGPTTFGGPKLVGVDLKTDRLFKTILLPQDVALPTSYLNDVRFNLKIGRAGCAFITDSSDNGPDGIIVVDLATGKNWRRLSGHSSTTAETDFAPKVD
ncbi:MAG TPA: L-dopachrome tautomerase-related protein, partial [Chthonomonadales bacterium]|nr:L-dopachrome tautomerase-related protein [Chthonomonadales bacterium]